MKTAQFIRRASLSILAAMILILFPGCDAAVQNEVGKMIKYHNEMVDASNSQIEAFERRMTRGVGRIPGQVRTGRVEIYPSLSQTVVELNKIFSAFNSKVQALDANGLPADVTSRFIDVQTTVASMAEMINKAATVDRRKFSSESSALDWFNEWDEQIEIYEKKLDDLVKAAEKYGIKAGWRL